MVDATWWWSLLKQWVIHHKKLCSHRPPSGSGAPVYIVMMIVLILKFISRDQSICPSSLPFSTNEKSPYPVTPPLTPNYLPCGRVQVSFTIVSGQNMTDFSFQSWKEKLQRHFWHLKQIPLCVFLYYFRLKMTILSTIWGIWQLGNIL